MAVIFRAVEADQGSWECHFWDHAFDQHPTLDEAVEHLRSLAQARGQSLEIAIYFHDGWVRRKQFPSTSEESATAGLGWLGSFEPQRTGNV
jgi:hypothetical protein